MELLLVLGPLFILGGISLIRYELLPEGNEPAYPLREKFGKALWRFWQTGSVVLERVTEEYEGLEGMYVAKNKSTEGFHRQSSVLDLGEKKIRAEGALYEYLADVHQSAGNDGVMVDTRSKIKISQSNVESDIEKADAEASRDLKMYHYDQMNTARREYHRLKSEGASKREIDNQKALLKELTEEWENISKN